MAILPKKETEIVLFENDDDRYRSLRGKKPTIKPNSRPKGYTGV